MVQPAAPPRRSNTANTAATVVLFVLLAGLALLAVVLSGFFVMATDPCGGTTTCDTDALFYAYLATWGGIAVAIVGSAVGTIVTGLRHGLTWYWPLIGIAVVLVSFVAGLALTSRVLPR
jgi:hypothetical protein